jgi:hypothetical protein
VPGRRTLTLLSLLLIPIAAWLFVPFRRPFRWSRLLWTYLIPVIPFVFVFDGLISCFRAYSRRELQDMTNELATNGYRWEIGEESGGLLPLRVTYLVGCPRRVSVEMTGQSAKV